MEFKHLSIEWKADDQGQIEGYGSVFDTVDLGGDIIAPGAFKQSLNSGRRVKMLFQHDASSVVGVWNTMEEDAKGLRVAGRMLTTVRAGAEAYELVKAGAIDGLSIGYRTVKSMDRNGKRVIMQADLWEVSLVTFPMNEMARIDAVKAAGLSERELERMLTRDAGLSRS
ncbi:MAG: HK97 family phage prohead protease, partial [Pseudomonadota bacterium]